MAWTLKNQPGYDEETAQALQTNAMPVMEAPKPEATQPIVNPMQQGYQAQSAQTANQPNAIAAQIKAAEDKRKKALAALLTRYGQVQPTQVQ